MNLLDSFEIAKAVINGAMEHSLRIAVAESCTGGMLSCYLTSVPGSSQVFERGYIVYTERAKREMLAVSGKVLKEQGAVSEEVALQMLRGVFEHVNVHIALTITGYAGPQACANLQEDVGMVYIGYGWRDELSCKKYTFLGNRNEIREQACKEALKLILNLIAEAK